MYEELLLVGNPNVGKTSVFNRLTRSSEHVGNWHGVTVAEKSKIIQYDDKALKITDLPGLYSLSPYSPEEQISVDKILHDNSSLIIAVCEVGNLQRNLFLLLQLMEAEKNVILVVNMVDELHRKGLNINCGLLSARLNVPVVATSAKYGKSAFEILECVRKYEKHVSYFPCQYLGKLPLSRAEKLVEEYAKQANVPTRWAALRFMSGDALMMDKLHLPEKLVAKNADLTCMREEICSARYAFIEKITDGIIFAEKEKSKRRKKAVGNKTPPQLCFFDKIALNPLFALPVFIVIMLLVFAVTFGPPGRFLSDLLQAAIDKFVYAPVFATLKDSSCPEWLNALICEGIINGMAGITVFLPQIVLLFLFLAVMEDSGYISRLAFMTDGLFGKIGLSGRSAITMLMGFGCSATAVMTTRGLEDENMRRKTAIITPFISCSARLPVYMTIGGYFFSAGNWLVIFFLYLLGAAVAFCAAAVMEKMFASLKSGKPSFIMEMPPYRMPTIERVFQIIKNNIKAFLIKVGTTIFSLNVIVWILSNFSFTSGYGAGEDSIMVTIGKAAAFIFKPLGFGSWQAVTALLSGFVAKEAVVTSIESLGGVSALFGGATAGLDAFCFMIFTLLYVPCIATVAALFKETGIKWTLAGMGVQLVTAYLLALAARLAGLLYMLYPGVAIAAAIIAACSVIAAVLIVRYGKKRCGECCNCGALCQKNK